MADVNVKKTILKPCPFCGGEVSISLTGKGTINWVYVTRGLSKTKKNCDCRLFMESEKYFIDHPESKKMAETAFNNLVEAWNRRATDG